MRRNLLLAATAIIDRAGVSSLTLDGVAKEAGASKGGLLHHFNSKADLLAALMDDLLCRFEDDMARLAKEDPEPRGRQIRAYIGALSRTEPHDNRLGMAVAAALLFDPALLTRWQRHSRRWFEEDACHAEPIDAGILRLAADGLWVSGAFAIHEMDGDLRAAMIQRLLDMTRSQRPPIGTGD